MYVEKISSLVVNKKLRRYCVVGGGDFLVFMSFGGVVRRRCGAGEW